MAPIDIYKMMLIQINQYINIGDSKIWLWTKLIQITNI